MAIAVWNFCGYTESMARPSKSKSERRENVLRIRLTDAERRVLDRAAEKKALDVSAWARMVLLAEANSK